MCKACTMCVSHPILQLCDEFFTSKYLFSLLPVCEYSTRVSVIFKYRLYNEDEGLSNIHDRGRSPRRCIFDDPESELHNRLVPECGGVYVSY